MKLKNNGKWFDLFDIYRSAVNRDTELYEGQPNLQNLLLFVYELQKTIGDQYDFHLSAKMAAELLNVCEASAGKYLRRLVRDRHLFITQFANGRKHLATRYRVPVRSERAFIAHGWWSGLDFAQNSPERQPEAAKGTRSGTKGMTNETFG